MWIISLAGKPSYWLIGGQIYRVGRKGCDVKFLEDPSVSRIHLSFEIHLATAQRIDGGGSSGSGGAATDDGPDGHHPAPITLIDSSTYGTVVCPGPFEPKEADTTAVADTPHVSLQPAPPPPRVVCETGITGLRYADRRGARQRQEQQSSKAVVAASAAVGEEEEKSRKRSRGPSATVNAETDVEVVGEAHTLTKGTPFRVPIDRPEWREFTVVLGCRNARFTFLWVDMQVAVQGVDVDLHTKLEHQLNRCGARIVPLPAAAPVRAVTCNGDNDGEEELRAANPNQNNSSSTVAGDLDEPDYLITGALGPTPAVLSMLLRGCPIVRPAYFAAVLDRPSVLDRTSVQYPLPDPRRFLPPIDLEAWAPLLPTDDECDSRRRRTGDDKEEDATAQTDDEDNNGDEDADDSAGLEWLLAPHPQRQRLFSGLTFVVFQPDLFHDVSQFLGRSSGSGSDSNSNSNTNGRVVWDDALAGIVNDRTKQSILPSFAKRHQRHVVLYSAAEAMPFRDCLPALQTAMGLCCLEHTVLVRAVLSVRAPQLAPFPGGDTVVSNSRPAAVGNGWPSAAPSRGRATIASPALLDPELTVVAAAAAQGPGRTGRGGAVRVIDENGWRSWVVPGGSEGEEADGEGEEEASPRKSRRIASSSSAAAAPRPSMPAATVVLPDWPCYEGSLNTVLSTGTAHTDKNGVIYFTGANTKTFRKQQVSAAVAAMGDLPRIELDWGRDARTAAANLLVSTVPAITSDSILPDRAAVLGLSRHRGCPGAFNTFDTAEHHVVQRKKAAKAPPKRRGAQAAVVAVSSSTATDSTLSAAVSRHRSADEPPEEVESSPENANASASAFNVFAIEGLF